MKPNPRQNFLMLSDPEWIARDPRPLLAYVEGLEEALHTLKAKVDELTPLLDALDKEHG